MRTILKEMGHKQPATPIQTDNAAAEGVINSKITPKRTKAMDMRFYWLRDRQTLEQFRFFWRAGKLNLADYWTKHHLALHHKNVRNKFLTKKRVLDELKQQLESNKSEKEIVHSLIKMRIGEDLRALRASTRVCRSQ